MALAASGAMPARQLDKAELRDIVRAALSELSERQLIGLRFASDEELPGLVEKTLTGKLEEKQIKQAVRNWRPDHWRV